MKINEAQSVAPVAASDGAGSSFAPPPHPDPADLITTNDVDRLRAAVQSGVPMAAVEHATRLTELVERVRSGAYRPSAAALADQILAEAELDARLAQSI
jgi:hypothetical protein